MVALRKGTIQVKSRIPGGVNTVNIESVYYVYELGGTLISTSVLAQVNKWECHYLGW